MNSPWQLLVTQKTYLRRLKCSFLKVTFLGHRGNFREFTIYLIYLNKLEAYSVLMFTNTYSDLGTSCLSLPTCSKSKEPSLLIRYHDHIWVVPRQMWLNGCNVCFCKSKLFISKSNITRYWTKYEMTKTKTLITILDKIHHSSPSLSLFWVLWRTDTARHRGYIA